MPEWLQAVLAVAGALASWRWILRPMRRAWHELVRLLSQIRDNAGGMQRLAFELHEMAGALTHYAVATLGRIDEHEADLAALHDRLDNLAELLIDTAADVARLQRKGKPHDQHPPDGTPRI